MKDKISFEELDQIIKSSINNEAIDPELENQTPEPESEKRKAEETDEESNKRTKSMDLLDLQFQKDQQSQSQSQSEQPKSPEPQPKEPDTDKDKTVIHEGIEIPADSELLNSNSAYTSYTEATNFTQIPVTRNSHLSALPLPIISPDISPRIQLLIQTLPTLDNLSTQLLRIFTIGPYQEVIELASNLENPKGATFRDLTSIFEFTKKLYSDDPFLSVTHIIPNLSNDVQMTNFFKNYQQSIESTLRKVNLSTFLLATLGIIEVGFYYLNESFLNIFCPLDSIDPETTICQMNTKIIQGNATIETDKIGKIFKHQAILYLELKTQAYISAIEAGDKSREEILDDILPSNLKEILVEKRGTKILNQSEQEFIDRCKARRTLLLNHQDDSTLSQEFEWFQFLKNLFEFISKNMAFLIWGNKKVSNIQDLKSLQDVTLSSTNHPTTTLPPPQSYSHPILNEVYDPREDLLPSEIQQRQLQLTNGPGPKSRISSRRPWTRDEEKALRHALELEGPHWSNILELFGPGGQINEALKNRTQTQLKDKARNWKMFFLKSGLPVPQYLQKVTGDLERDDRHRRKKLAKK